MQKAIVLGVHSFLDHNSKVGIQYIAEGLLEHGWRVDYLSLPSSALDLYGRLQRLSRVWIDRQDIRGIEIKPGLKEYAFRTFHPAHRIFLRSRWSMEHYCQLAPKWLTSRHYDICIHDITANVLFLHLISADYFVLRLNDLPDGFAFDIHQILIDLFKKNIASGIYHEIWAVSEPLSAYALQLNPANQVVVIPNGVEDRFLLPTGQNIFRQLKTAIYLGTISQWIDLDLLEKSSILLPDWQFYIYGTKGRSLPKRLSNLHLYPPISRAAVPNLLAGFQVGLIPFRETCGRMKYVERPLKFYEYIASGLGVASTDVGSLKAGMGDLAVYGNTPREFANAIKCAAKNGNSRTSDFNRAFIEKHSWKNIINQMCMRISKLQSK